MSILKSNKIICFILLVVLAVVFICPQQCWAVRKKSGPAEVQFIAKDGFNLTGLIEVPKNKSVKNKVPLVILLHSLGGSTAEWYDYPSKIKPLGVAVLSLDMRGHGKSILDKRGKRKYWQNFTNDDFHKYADDINSAIDYIRKEYPEVDNNRIAIVAGDVSANAAIIAASRNSLRVKTLVLFSPTVGYKGLETRIPLVGYGSHPVLILVSKPDKYSYYGSAELIKYAQGVKVLKVYPYGGTGINLLKIQPESKQLVIDWLNKYLMNR